MPSMTVDSPADRAEWQPSPVPDDGVISPEHLALVDFAHRLGSLTSNEEPGIAKDVRDDANLLMSLLSSPPHVVCDDLEHNSVGSAGSSAVVDHHYLSDASTSSATASTTSSTASRRDSFRFSHPSLSLDGKWKSLPINRPIKTPCTAPEKGDDSQPPAVLLGRALKVDDREAHRLSADAMARNLLQSFQKAIKWRIQAWMNTLAECLVKKEKELKQRNATDAEMRDLLKSSEAQLYTKLRQVAQSIEVQQAETVFHVLPQRIQREHQEEEDKESGGGPIVKRRRIDSEDSELSMGETEYQYTVCHNLEFDGIIHLNTPAGHSEITVEVPGFIEGTFLSSDPGMEDLKAVEVQIDTNILASMVEKSCRLIVRTSVEHLCKPKSTATAETEDSTEKEYSKPKASLLPRFQGTTALPDTGSNKAVIVTPRAQASNFVGTNPADEPVFLQIPDDLDSVNREGPRRISPQTHPRSPDFGLNQFTPATPSKHDDRKPLPSMVSPAPKGEVDESEEGGVQDGPNLPVLVEVACAAMQVKAGLKGY